MLPVERPLWLVGWVLELELGLAPVLVGPTFPVVIKDCVEVSPLLAVGLAAVVLKSSAFHRIWIGYATRYHHSPPMGVAYRVCSSDRLSSTVAVRAAGCVWFWQNTGHENGDPVEEAPPDRLGQPMLLLDVSLEGSPQADAPTWDNTTRLFLPRRG